MKKINSIGVIIDLHHATNSIWKYKIRNLFEYLNKIQGNNLSSYVIDISNVFTFKKNKINYQFKKINKKQYFLKPKNIFELYKISKKINCISMYQIPDNFRFVFKQFILKIFGFKRFSILGRGYISDNSQPNSTSIQNKLRYLKDNRINCYFISFKSIRLSFKKFFFAIFPTIIFNLFGGKPSPGDLKSRSCIFIL